MQAPPAALNSVAAGAPPQSAPPEDPLTDPGDAGCMHAGGSEQHGLHGNAPATTGGLPSQAAPAVEQVSHTLSEPRW